MLDDIEENRDAAVRRYAKDLDRWERPEFRVTEAEIDAALNGDLRQLGTAIERALGEAEAAFAELDTAGRLRLRGLVARPDGQRIVMSLQDGANSSINELDLRTKQTRRLTSANAIDTAPCYAPDGRAIVFESDREGTQQLYVMGYDGGGQRRLSQGEGRYSTPVWSPRGDYIAFTRQARGQFAIGVMRPDGSGERILTESYLDEAPTWSPNGRVIMFFREGRGTGARLWSVDLTGRNLRQIPTQTDASDPAWSPLLP